jgi:ribosome-associated toxin RatA of RatAB toxin-antitoxin module
MSIPLWRSLMNNREDFEYQCESFIDIQSSKELVYQALFDVSKWTSLLPHITNIKVLYDDGKYQEFIMSVQSESDVGELTVRSVRMCDYDNMKILFFQPEPPAFLKHHGGGWEFTQISQNICRVKTYHQWNLCHDVARQKFEFCLEDYPKHIESILIGHAQFALKNWKSNLETKLVGDPSLS